MATERRWLFIITVLAALILSAILALRQPLEFEASALVRVKVPPLPKESSVHFGWDKSVWYSPDLAIEVAKRTKISEETRETWPVVSWLSEGLRVEETDGLVMLKLRGGFPQHVVRDTLAVYIEEAAEKLTRDLRSTLESESARLNALHQALEEHRQRVVQTLMTRVEARTALLHSQKESLEQALQELLKARTAQMRVGEPGATLESWYYRNYVESLLRRLEEIERELDRLTTMGIAAMEREYQRVLDLEERLEALAQAQVEVQQILKGWEPLEVVTPARLPQGPIGPNRLQIILWGTGIGVIIGVLMAFFFPRRREPSKT
ncbi:MAG: hypothetical protein NZ930_01940 [Candidatus Bipolaricaulota bacterium]|nr:hypothetical protein [Candidatus Bipolaricaulota bacterium]MDW8030946.1 hypothetical protein [Candidatus Bipolaricaulota bacterium]